VCGDELEIEDRDDAAIGQIVQHREPPGAISPSGDSTARKSIEASSSFASDCCSSDMV
jgi:hypothetical protein